MINLEFLRTNKIKTGANQEVVAFIDNLYTSTSKMYLKQHKDWYISDRFVRGDHWIAYNKTLNRIQTIPISSGEVRRTINKIRAQLRGVKNFIKRSQPRWEVHPNGVSNDAYKEANWKNKILQNVFRKKQLKKNMTDLIINGLKYSAGFLEGGMIKKNGKDTIDFWVDSTYDILPDPYSNSIQNCRYIFKTFVKPVEDVKRNKNYKIENGELSDNREAASDYKNILELEKYSKESNKGSKDLDTVVVKELWMKWEEGGETKIRVITVCGKNIARVYNPKYRRYPFFLYTPERDGEAIFSQPWLKDLISINKSLDKTASQIEAYVQRMLAGKLLIKKGVEVSTFTDKGAEKVYYKGQTAPKQLDLQPLPSTPFSYMSDLERWLEELGGVREASLGRAAGSLQSGKGIEALQSADAGTVAEPIENLELMLQDVGEFILELIADHQIASKTIVENNEDIKFVGSVAETKIEGAITIDGDDEVKVTIVPEVAYSEDAKKEWIMRLADAKLIDPETLLEQFKFSNVSDIIARVEKKKAEDFKEEMMKQRESHRTDGNGLTDTADLADQENMQMAAGQEVPATPKALWTPEHTQLHIAFIKENQDAYSQHQQAFDDHIRAEEQYNQ